MKPRGNALLSYTGWFLVLILLSPVHPAYSKSRTGQESVKDGVRHVVNPANPVKPPETVQLEELWRIGGESEEEGELFGLIRGLTADQNGSVYVMDYQLSQVSMFSPEGEFVRTIGREGEGPGDLRRPDSMCLSPKGFICVAMAYPSRIALFDTTGDPVGTITIPENKSGAVPIIFRIARAGDHLVMHGVSRKTRFICAIDDNGIETARYHEEMHSFDEATPVYEEKSGSLTGRWDVGPNGKVYVASSFYDYEMSVYNPDGEISYIVERDYEHRKRSKEEKQFVHDWANVNPAAILPGTRFEIEDYDKDIMALHCRDDGTCWVLTSRGFYDRPDGSIGVFDVLDSDGTFVRQVTLLGVGDPHRDRYHFFGDRLYVVTCFTAAVARMTGGGQTDNRFASLCAEPMSVICYRVDSQ
ncbi:MAG: hypothetical protein JSW58_10075 [Candidatus Latescibacterota bacterium]|nr:MAG: hypothetical protein JSW58_10075 [Candidatus Latescibacterota bacterium]